MKRTKHLSQSEVSELVAYCQEYASNYGVLPLTVSIDKLRYDLNDIREALTENKTKLRASKHYALIKLIATI